MTRPRPHPRLTSPVARPVDPRELARIVGGATTTVTTADKYIGETEKNRS